MRPIAEQFEKEIRYVKFADYGKSFHTTLQAAESCERIYNRNMGEILKEIIRSDTRIYEEGSAITVIIRDIAKREGIEL